MSSETAFIGAGQVAGKELWRIEKLKPVKQPEANGKFHVGDSYILLVSTKNANGKLDHAIHFWLGAETSDDEKGIAAYKSVELDDKFGGAATQYREVQGAESALFLSYFKNTGGIEYLPGGVVSGFKKVERDVYETRLLHCKGARTVRVSPVPVSGSSLNKGDVFILDLGLKLYVFNGPNASRLEKAKGLEVASRLDNDERGGRAIVILIDDDPQNAEFWGTLGGYKDPASLPEGEPDSVVVEEKKVKKLFSIGADGGLSDVTPGDGKLTKSLLQSENAYLLHSTSTVYIWIGKKASANSKKEATKIATNYLKSAGLPASTAIQRVSEGVENSAFKSEFSKWEIVVVTKRNIAANDDTPVDVSAILKNKAIEETPFDDGSGKLEVWVVENFDLTPVDKSKHGQFYGGDSYVILYTYKKDDKDEYFLYFWLGNQSSKDEIGTAALKATEMDNKYGGRPVQVRVVQGKEPAHFRQLFKGKLIIHSGGKASAFKNVNDADSHDTDGTALFRVRGSTALNTAATQVPEVAASLNSEDTFVLVTPSTVYSWNGKGANTEEKATALSVANILANDSFGKGGRSVVVVAEGAEPAEFWSAIGGEGPYQESAPGDDLPRDPRLFQCNNVTGAFRVLEIPDFTQADLNDEDVFLLDTYTAIYLWIGSQSNEVERSKSSEFAKQYITAADDGRDKDSPIITIHAGSEPVLFTSYFVAWDSNLNKVYVDPYEKKLQELKVQQDALKATLATESAHATPAATPRVTPGSSIFSWDQVVAGVEGIDLAHREDYLDDATFKEHLGVDKVTFNGWPKWKRDDLKKKKGIF